MSTFFVLFLTASDNSKRPLIRHFQISCPMSGPSFYGIILFSSYVNYVLFVQMIIREHCFDRSVLVVFYLGILNVSAVINAV